MCARTIANDNIAANVLTPNPTNINRDVTTDRAVRNAITIRSIRSSGMKTYSNSCKLSSP